MQKMPSFAAKGGILCYERWHLLHQKMPSFTYSPLTIRIRGIRDVSYFFTGTLSRISSRCFQNLSTVGISIRSSGECTPCKVGPKEIISSAGYLSRNRPHSSPAWIAFTLASTPNKRLYDSTAISSISECGLGFQPG